MKSGPIALRVTKDVLKHSLRMDYEEAYAYSTASAGDLAKDVQRYLAGEPASAYDEPRSVRLRRWAARHRTLVTATAANAAGTDKPAMSCAIPMATAAASSPQRAPQPRESPVLEVMHL